uniref:NADAR domain-containing protein n=1 Tax=Paramoeba aestuarina TaxID=180227 RepID=A0A7S4NKS3_9EUKA|eukprot:CAMPEP_0201511914 /NCGR_PEP_ID=MMETSP0161_2-20130828/4288_1 /ASSEMBLY_ACC=CAM_ASM_000251 /TAXON_ID=180227 /ORGANISM="Neoparamoeba aestuarina, Strain SoJaBio B1-5/56/2" /LENGTH=178 /DNA_ID=CAMNT_0047907575 /DNA_START=101 /DNA_END=637 /DNA_ORIENTATION=+
MAAPEDNIDNCDEVQEKFTFFHRGPFSQWHKSKFYEDGVEFSSAEQYMMYQKAKLFNDQVTANKIMKTHSPKEQKALGRQVRGFKNKVWNNNKEAIVTQGNYLKFSQNKELREHLFNTTGTTLVEASPNDTIWGIGLHEADPRAQSRDTWLGENLLGQCLNNTRARLMKEEEEKNSTK